MAHYAFPPPPPAIDATPLQEIDARVERVRAHKDAWLRVSVGERAELCQRLLEAVVAEADAWADVTNRAQGHRETTPEAGEVWLAAILPTVRNLRLLRDSLRDIAEHGSPRLPGPVRTRPDGRTVARVFPANALDRVLLTGHTAEVWMEPGVTPANLSRHMARAYREKATSGKVALVLGAGNLGSIPPMDAFYKLFVDDEVVVLKLNPVNEYLGPVYERALSPLIERGVLEIVYGGAEHGAHLCRHPGVDTIHITGSDQTYDAIVWGPAEGRGERKARGERANTKPITAELGNVTPIVVVPGPWTDAEMDHHAWNVATMVVNNASFNCTAGKLLVLPRDWALRDAFLARVKAALAGSEPRKAYYPGARERWKSFVDAHPKASILSADATSIVPWTVIEGLDPDRPDDLCFRKEPFCGVLNVVDLPGRSAVEFLPRAVALCNDKVWGSLAAMILVHPKTRAEPASEAAFQEALDDLRFGNIGVNCWVGVSYGIAITSWGAHPGHPPEDIQSGAGIVHNALMFDRPQKSVTYAPFTVLPKPPFFVNHRRALQMGRRLVDLEARPRLRKIPGLLVEALRG
jgi:acyl-CoA reductase-like NAD-dependent aldehyde dehydrogenase